MTRRVQIRHVAIGAGAPLALIAGPCVIETEVHALRMAEALATLTQRMNVPFVFKSSYDKANRTSINGFRGIGLEPGLSTLEKISELGIPTLTDVHETAQVDLAASVVDCLQIPALLARQTDLLLEVGRSGRCVNIKKSPMMSPWDIGRAIEKIASTGNDSVLLTERGTSFGYNNLVVDFRSLQVIRKFGYPIVFDGSHSVQLPGALGDSSAGQTEHVGTLSRAAAAVGIDALFLEVHDDPERALSDGQSSVRLESLPALLAQVLEIDATTRRVCPEAYRASLG